MAEFERRFPLLMSAIFTVGTIGSMIDIGNLVSRMMGWGEAPWFWPMWFNFWTCGLALLALRDWLRWAG